MSGMVCSVCRAETSVVSTDRKANRVERLRRCTNGHVFRTVERLAIPTKKAAR